LRAQVLPPHQFWLIINSLPRLGGVFRRLRHGSEAKDIFWQSERESAWV
jgi:hypothetical protein